MRGQSAAALRALRSLYEGAPVTIELLAAVSGRSAAHLARLVKREGWQEAAVDGENPEALERRVMVLSDRLIADLEAASAEGQAGGGYDKGRIDALSSMLRMVEKIGEMTRGPERAAEKQKRSDAELAAALALIDARIVELACELAASMGGSDAGRECGDRRGSGVAGLGPAAAISSGSTAQG